MARGAFLLTLATSGSTIFYQISGSDP